MFGFGKFPINFVLQNVNFLCTLGRQTTTSTRNDQNTSSSLSERTSEDFCESCRATSSDQSWELRPNKTKVCDGQAERRHSRDQCSRIHHRCLRSSNSSCSSTDSSRSGIVQAYVVIRSRSPIARFQSTAASSPTVAHDAPPQQNRIRQLVSEPKVQQPRNPYHTSRVSLFCNSMRNYTLTVPTTAHNAAARDSEDRCSEHTDFSHLPQSGISLRCPSVDESLQQAESEAPRNDESDNKNCITLIECGSSHRQPEDIENKILVKKEPIDEKPFGNCLQFNVKDSEVACNSICNYSLTLPSTAQYTIARDCEGSCSGYRDISQSTHSRTSLRSRSVDESLQQADIKEHKCNDSKVRKLDILNESRSGHIESEEIENKTLVANEHSDVKNIAKLGQFNEKEKTICRVSSNSVCNYLLTLPATAHSLPVRDCEIKCSQHTASSSSPHNEISSSQIIDEILPRVDKKENGVVNSEIKEGSFFTGNESIHQQLEEKKNNTQKTNEQPDVNVSEILEHFSVKEKETFRNEGDSQGDVGKRNDISDVVHSIDNVQKKTKTSAIKIKNEVDEIFNDCIFGNSSENVINADRSSSSEGAPPNLINDFNLHSFDGDLCQSAYLENSYQSIGKLKETKNKNVSGIIADSERSEDSDKGGNEAKVGSRDLDDSFQARRTSVQHIQESTIPIILHLESRSKSCQQYVEENKEDTGHSDERENNEHLYKLHQRERSRSQQVCKRLGSSVSCHWGKTPGEIQKICQKELRAAKLAHRKGPHQSRPRRLDIRTEGETCSHKSRRSGPRSKLVWKSSPGRQLTGQRTRIENQSDWEAVDFKEESLRDSDNRDLGIWNRKEEPQHPDLKKKNASETRNNNSYVNKKSKPCSTPQENEKVVDTSREGYGEGKEEQVDLVDKNSGRAATKDAEPDNIIGYERVVYTEDDGDEVTVVDGNRTCSFCGRKLPPKKQKYLWEPKFRTELRKTRRRFGKQPEAHRRNWKLLESHVFVGSKTLRCLLRKGFRVKERKCRKCLITSIPGLRRVTANPFINFYMVYVRNTQGSCPKHAPTKSLASEAGEIWNSMTKSERRPFVKMAQLTKRLMWKRAASGCSWCRSRFALRHRPHSILCKQPRRRKAYCGRSSTPWLVLRTRRPRSRRPRSRRPRSRWPHSCRPRNRRRSSRSPSKPLCQRGPSRQGFLARVRRKLYEYGQNVRRKLREYGLKCDRLASPVLWRPSRSWSPSPPACLKRRRLQSLAAHEAKRRRVSPVATPKRARPMKDMCCF